MPNFLGWHVDEKTNEPGALVQFDKGRSFKFDPEKMNFVAHETGPRTEFFNGEKIAATLEKAGASAGWWRDLQQSFEARLPLIMNSRDISGVTSKVASLDADLKPVAAPKMTV